MSSKKYYDHPSLAIPSWLRTKVNIDCDDCKIVKVLKRPIKSNNNPNKSTYKKSNQPTQHKTTNTTKSHKKVQQRVTINNNISSTNHPNNPKIKYKNKLLLHHNENTIEEKQPETSLTAKILEYDMDEDDRNLDRNDREKVKHTLMKHLARGSYISVKNDKTLVWHMANIDAWEDRSGIEFDTNQSYNDWNEFEDVFSSMNDHELYIAIQKLKIEERFWRDKDLSRIWGVHDYRDKQVEAQREGTKITRSKYWPKEF